MRKQKLFLLIGPACSGKSYYAPSLNAVTVKGAGEGRTIEEAAEEAKMILEKGMNAAIDSVERDPKSWENIFDITGRDWNKTAIVFITPLDECLAFNAKKDEPDHEADVVRDHMEFRKKAEKADLKEYFDRVFFFSVG